MKRSGVRKIRFRSANDDRQRSREVRGLDRRVETEDGHHRDGQRDEGRSLPSSGASPRGRTSAVSVATSGTTPTPIATAPRAQIPYSSMRVLQKARGEIPRERPPADRRRQGRLAIPVRSTAEADPVAPRPGLAPPARASRAPEPSEQDEYEHREQDGERVRTRTPRKQEARREPDRPACGGQIPERAIRRTRASRRDRPPARRRGRANRRARARQPHRRPRRGRKAETNDEPREVVGGEDRRGHERAHPASLIREVGRWTSAQPPGGGGEVGEERDARRGLAEAGAERRLAGIGDRARDLRELDLVAEQSRRLAAPGLPRIERTEARHEGGHSERRVEVGPPAWRSLGWDLDERRRRDLGSVARTGTELPRRRTPRRRRPGDPGRARERDQDLVRAERPE